MAIESFKGKRVRLKRDTHFENYKQVGKGATGVCIKSGSLFSTVLLDEQFHVQETSIVDWKTKFTIDEVVMFSDEIEII